MAVTEERLEQLWILIGELRGEVQDTALGYRIDELLETLNDHIADREPLGVGI